MLPRVSAQLQFQSYVLPQSSVRDWTTQPYPCRRGCGLGHTWRGTCAPAPSLDQEEVEHTSNTVGLRHMQAVKPQQVVADIVSPLRSCATTNSRKLNIETAGVVGYIVVSVIPLSLVARPQSLQNRHQMPPSGLQWRNPWGLHPWGSFKRVHRLAMVRLVLPVVRFAALEHVQVEILGTHRTKKVA